MPYQTSSIATRLRIVVADDNRDAAETLALLLELRGHAVVTVNDGDAAIAAFTNDRPDVMILDVGMPRLSGHEACSAIRALPDGDRVLMVALTGWGQTSDRERSRDAGFDAHLVKPVPHEVLLHAIERRPEQSRS
ncbi:response regulator [Gemmatimonas groenlandica]|uniref:Response regulator n=1 Tax=Gemmatimonas groenlandica TaxID=2732249 RepID=A0A6M4ILP7_9BACT|nr:response regulator [Gemmatimonas groenlandica]QJR35944.1 response regulator [Gemmatimonas groenlandica]